MGFLGESAPPASCLGVPIEAVGSRWPNPKRDFLSFIVGVRFVSAPWRVLFDWGFGVCHNTLTHPVGKCAGREIARGDFFSFPRTPAVRLRATWSDPLPGPFFRLIGLAEMLGACKDFTDPNED